LFPLDAEVRRLGWLIKVETRMRRLRELTFGIVDLGRFGTAAALRAKALGFNERRRIRLPLSGGEGWREGERQL
jgi:phosphoglycerate dehydrogenase-like enzyme